MATTKTVTNKDVESQSPVIVEGEENSEKGGGGQSIGVIIGIIIGVLLLLVLLWLGAANFFMHKHKGMGIHPTDPKFTYFLNPMNWRAME